MPRNLSGPSVHDTISVEQASRRLTTAPSSTQSIEDALTFSDRLRRMLSRIYHLFEPSTNDRPSLYVPTRRAGDGKSDLPSRIGDWMVLDVAGAGTSATVYRVVPSWAPASARHYALKLHDGQASNDHEARNRFRREVRILRSIRHRNVVGLIDNGEYNGRQFLVMEMVEGLNLRQAPEKHDPPLSGKLDWAIQICRALEVIHGGGIIHRDLKPENIMVTRLNVIKVTDFGLARNDDNQSLTRNGLLVGTPAYMAPEYLRGLEPDSRSDLYSMGMLLYELLTGAMPYNAVTVSDFINAHLDAAPIPMRVRVPSLPRPLDTLILRLLEKRPDRRIQSATELREGLEEVLARLVGQDSVRTRQIA